MNFSHVGGACCLLRVWGHCAAELGLCVQENYKSMVKRGFVKDNEKFTIDPITKKKCDAFFVGWRPITVCCCWCCCCYRFLLLAGGLSRSVNPSVPALLRAADALVCVLVIPWVCVCVRVPAWHRPGSPTARRVGFLATTAPTKCACCTRCVPGMICPRPSSFVCMRGRAMLEGCGF
jgi:hypothetical protein